jgi:hypothetical protein
MNAEYEVLNADLRISSIHHSAFINHHSFLIRASTGMKYKSKMTDKGSRARMRPKKAVGGFTSKSVI